MQLEKLVKALIALGIYPLFSGVAAPPALVQTPENRQPERNQLLHLTGTQEPQIKVLKGSPSETVRFLFKGGSWIFYPDGKFIFTPSESANVRTDIFPIYGTYTKEENNWLIFQGERDSSGASASVDGVVHFQKNSIVLDVVYTASALDNQRIAKISQILSRQAKSSPVIKIQGIPVPAIFDISLQGKTETQAFNSTPATLKIVPSLPGEPNPFSVILSTASINQVGSLLWQSFVSRLSGGGDVVSKVTVRRNQVHLEVDSPPLYGVTWFTIPSGQAVPNLPIGASIKRGTLNFSIQGASISGEISATGVSDLDKPSTYSARFTGNIQQNSRGGVAPPAEETPPLPVTNLQTPESSFSGSWNTEVFGRVELRQSGQKVSGTYSGTPTGRGGGTLDGVVRGNRLDFTWRDAEKKEGWGFFRAISGGRTLAGLWGQGTDKTKGEELVAKQIERVSPPVPDAPKEELRDLGYNLALQNRCAAAVAPLRKALQLYKQERGNSRTWNLIRDTYLIDEVNILTRLSHCYYHLEDYDKLLESLRDAVEIRQILKERKYLRGIAKQQADLVQVALTGYLENWRQTLTNDLDKIDALEKGQPFFLELTQFFVELDSPQEALVVSENARARALADILAQKLEKYADAPNLKEIQEISKTQKATIVEYLLLDSESKVKSDSQSQAKELLIWVVKPTGKVTLRRVDLKYLRQQQKNSLQDLISDKFRYLTTNTISKRGNEGRPPISQLTFAKGDRVRLNDSESGSEAYEVQSVNTQNSTIKIRLPSWEPGFTIERPIADIVEKVGAPGSNSAANAKNDYLQQLYRVLIKPIADLLPTDSNARVIFIPQGQLFTVPFPALQDENGHYLIEKHTIITAPAIQVLQLTHQLRQRAPGMATAAVVVGNPTNSLPEAAEEAKAIASLLHTKALIGDKATKLAILPQLPKARIIHFATHGFLDDFTGGKVPGAIALAPSGGDNGLLTASEILKLKLNAELVVLSACNTGQGNITGEGVIGLSRSLISAGVPSVIVSLWSVPDAPTGELMKEFYKNLGKNPDKATALRSAMLATIALHPEPRDWAAFTLIGESH